eukprot:469676-Pleurochrysis_carterae.AAC.3
MSYLSGPGPRAPRSAQPRRRRRVGALRERRHALRRQPLRRPLPRPEQRRRLARCRNHHPQSDLSVSIVARSAPLLVYQLQPGHSSSNNCLLLLIAFPLRLRIRDSTYCL